MASATFSPPCPTHESIRRARETSVVTTFSTDSNLSPRPKNVLLFDFSVYGAMGSGRNFNLVASPVEAFIRPERIDRPLEFRDENTAQRTLLESVPRKRGPGRRSNDKLHHSQKPPLESSSNVRNPLLEYSKTQQTYAPCSNPSFPPLAQS